MPGCSEPAPRRRCGAGGNVSGVLGFGMGTVVSSSARVAVSLLGCDNEPGFGACVCVTARLLPGPLVWRPLEGLDHLPLQWQWRSLPKWSGSMGPETVQSDPFYLSTHVLDRNCSLVRELTCSNKQVFSSIVTTACTWSGALHDA
jgi:hypothetical protein